MVVGIPLSRHEGGIFYAVIIQKFDKQSHGTWSWSGIDMIIQKVWKGVIYENYRWKASSTTEWDYSSISGTRARCDSVFVCVYVQRRRLLGISPASHRSPIHAATISILTIWLRVHDVIPGSRLGFRRATAPKFSSVSWNRRLESSGSSPHFGLGSLIVARDACGG